MSDYKKLVDKRWIAIGKSLPFSIYDSQRKLLLAQGHVVESERSLQRLVEHGQYYKAELSAGPRDVIEEELAADPVDPLTALNRDYSNIQMRARCGVKISPKETGESYLCWVIGVSHENRCLVMSAPARPDKALAAITKGQVWFCRMFSSTTVFRFRGAILKVAFDPYPYVHILVPEVIEKRLIRHLPRALVSHSCEHTDSERRARRLLAPDRDPLAEGREAPGLRTRAPLELEHAARRPRCG